MSSVSLSKPLRATAAAPRRAAKGRKADRVQAASEDDQDRSAAAQGAISPTVFWKVVTALAMALSVYNAIGMVLFGPDWLTVYWDAWDYWCAGGYCR